MTQTFVAITPTEHAPDDAAEALAELVAALRKEGCEVSPWTEKGGALGALGAGFAGFGPDAAAGVGIEIVGSLSVAAIAEIIREKLADREGLVADRAVLYGPDKQILMEIDLST